MSGREYNKIETKYVETRRGDSTRSDPENNKHEKGQKNFEGKLRFDSRSDDPDVVRS